MEIKPEEFKLLYNFILWSYSKGIVEDSESAKAAYAAAVDLALSIGGECAKQLDECVRTVDFGKCGPAAIAREFFDDADMLSPKLKAKVHAFDAIAKYVTPTLLETVDGRNLISVQGLYVPVNKLEFKAIAAAKGGARL